MRYFPPPLTNLLVLLIIVGALPSPARAEGEPWKIEAQHLTYYHASQTVIGERDVKVWRDDFEITADRIIYNKRKATVSASGAVVIKLKGDVLRGDEGEFDLNTLTGTVSSAHLFLKRNNVNLVAATIRKVGPEEYRAEEATISTCPLPRQAWSFHCRDLRLTVSGIAVAKKSTFRIRDIPVLYSPWLAVPVNRYRKTGFLLPAFATSSRNGAELTVPFFWAINDSMDATFYQHPISNRGWMEGAELRYMASDIDKGIMRYNFLSDTLQDEDFNNDGFVRGNEGRWWLRAKADQQMPWGFEAKMDLDLVSDRDYLQEFDQGPMSFSDTNSLFRKVFNRSLADDTDPVRPSTFQTTRIDNDRLIAGEIRYNDNQIDEDRDGTVQSLPRIALYGFKTRLRHTPLFFDWKTSYVHYWRDEDVREQRLHLEPRLSLPVDLHGWADLLLSGTVEETLYDAGGEDSAGTTFDRTNRFLHTLEADLSTTMGRTFTMSSTRLLRHTIRPRLTYLYRPSEDQDDLPDIDALDRLDPTNKITYSLLSFLTSRKALGNSRFAYRDVVRLRIEQSYDIRESRRDVARGQRREPFSDIYGEIEVRPADFLFLRYDTTLSAHGEGFTSYNLWGRYSAARGNRLDLEYRYNRLADIHELNLYIRAALSRSWYGVYRLRESLIRDTEVESLYGLRYQASCWALEGGLKHDKDETRITFHVELSGIGGWGKIE